MNMPVDIKRKITVLQVCGLVGVLLAASGLGLLAYWEFWPLDSQIFKFLEPVRVEQNPIVPGEYAGISLHYWKNPKYDHLQADVTVTFIDGVAQPVTLSSGIIPSGENKISVKVPVPPLKAGICRVAMTRLYHKSPTRTTDISSISEPVKVEEPPPVSANSQELLQRIDELLHENQVFRTRIESLLRSNRDLIEATRSARAK